MTNENPLDFHRQTYKCPYENTCMPPKDDYRCNIAYPHCIIYKRFKRDDMKKNKLNKKLLDKLFEEDMRDY